MRAFYVKKKNKQVRKYFLPMNYMFGCYSNRLREGFKKTANYPHFVDKGEGDPRMWISDGGGDLNVDKKNP